ncbi:MAG: tRNA pseudouridine(55) synthase TruB [Thermodesulfobacteriota bacterium]|nr:tRNA pseudouridine(55) synthase TruB [Thermodesulfobacteriota bacterium]
MNSDKKMIHGIIAVDKPEGISSARAVARIKKSLNVKKAGHTGTLDPFATGLLLCGINKGTKISRFFLTGVKKYRAVIHLGVDTDTLDSTGTVEKEYPASIVAEVTEDKIFKALAKFTGPQSQVPPAYSALKHNGQPLYRLARAGTPVIKPPRDIEIFGITFLKKELSFITLDVHCSSGTYIRSLARDIGNELGCGGHLSALCRTESCGFSIKKAVSLFDLENMDQETAEKCVMPMADALPSMPIISADKVLMEKIRFGREIRADFPMTLQEKTLDNFYFKIIDENKDLAAIVEFDKSSEKFKYCCVFAN